MQKLSSYGPSIVVLLTAVIVLVAGPSAIYRLSHAHTMARVYEASKHLEGDNILQQINQAYRDIATAVEPSVVHISASRGSDSRQAGANSRLSSGSGWIYDEAGYVVTNFHVIDQAERIDVQLYNGQMRPAEVVGADPSTDIAVLKIPTNRLNPLHAAVRVEPGREIRRGDKVFAFGSPFDFRFSMSAGVVSGMGRHVGIINHPLVGAGYENFIQVDAAINPGNSGGPLTDFRGHVIGMNTAIATSAHRARGDEGYGSSIGLAIPIDMIEPVVSQLIETGEVQKGFLGVRVVDRAMRVADEYAELNYRGTGIVISNIGSEERQRFSELRTGDVLAQVGGNAVRSREELEYVVQGFDLNEEIELTIWRYDAERNRGRYERISVPADIVMSDLLAVGMVGFGESVATRLSHLGFREEGVLLGDVYHDQPAGQAGLRQGDVVTHVNGKRVAQASQLRSMISSMMPGEKARLNIWRYSREHGYGIRKDFVVPLARLESHYAGMPMPSITPGNGLQQLGMARVDTLTESLARDYSIEYRPGVLVRAIVPDSHLAQQVRPGSVIVNISDTPVTTVEELEQALGEVNLRVGVRAGIVDPNNSYSVITLRIN